ncbi:type IV pilus assembly protein FimV [Glaciimonas sp. GG7]
MRNNIPQTTYHPKNNCRHLNNMHGHISPRKIQQFYDRISGTKNIGVQRPARARASLSAFQEGRELISASAINAEELRERLGMQSTTPTYQQSKAAFYLHVYGVLGGILPAANQIPVSSAAEAYRERFTSYFPAPRVTRHAGPASPASDKNQSSNNNQGEKTVSVSLASNRTEHAKTDADRLFSAPKKLRHARSAVASPATISEIQDDLKQANPIIATTNKRAPTPSAAVLTSPSKSLSSIPFASSEAPSGTQPSPILSESNWIPRITNNCFLRSFYHYLREDYGSWAEVMDTSEVLVLLRANLVAHNNNLTKRTQDFMPVDVTTLDQIELNRLMRPLMRSCGFYEGTRFEPIDTVFQQQTVAILLATLIAPAGVQEPFSLGGFSFLQAARQGLTVEETKQAFVQHIQLQHPGLTLEDAQWVGYYILSSYEPLLMRSDTPGDMVYQGFPWAKLQVALDTAHELSLEPQQYSKEILGKMVLALRSLIENNTQWKDTAALSEIYSGMRYADAIGKIDLLAPKENATATIVTAMRVLDEAHRPARTGSLKQWAGPIDLINSDAATRAQLGRKMLLARGIPPDEKVTLYHADLDNPNEKCANTFSILEYFLSGCTLAHGSVVTHRYPQMPSVAALNATFEANFQVFSENVVAQWNALMLKSIGDLNADDSFDNATKVEVLSPSLEKRLLKDSLSSGLPPGLMISELARHAKALTPVTYPTDHGGLILRVTTPDQEKLYGVSFRELGVTLINRIDDKKMSLSAWLDADRSRFFSNVTLDALGKWPEENTCTQWHFNVTQLMPLSTPNDMTAISTRLTQLLLKPMLDKSRAKAYGMTEVELDRHNVEEQEKYFFPFIECANKLESGNVVGAIFPCAVDALVAVPLVGALAETSFQLARTGLKFSEQAAMEVAEIIVGRDLSMGNMRSAADAIMQPEWIKDNIASKITPLGIHTLSTAAQLMDPGIEMLHHLCLGSAKIAQISKDKLASLASLLSHQRETESMGRDIEENLERGLRLSPQTGIWSVSDDAIRAGVELRLANFIGGKAKTISVDGQPLEKNALVKDAEILDLEEEYFYLANGKTGNKYGSLLRRTADNQLVVVAPLPDTISMSRFNNRRGEGVEIEFPPHVDVEHLNNEGLEEQGFAVFEIGGKKYAVDIRDRNKPFELQLVDDIERRLGGYGQCREKRAPAVRICEISKRGEDEYLIATDKEIFQERPGSKEVYKVDYKVIAHTKKIMSPEKIKKGAVRKEVDYTYVDGKYIFIHGRENNYNSAVLNKKDISELITFPADIEGTIVKIEDNMGMDLHFDHGYRLTVPYATYRKDDGLYLMLHIGGDTYYGCKLTEDAAGDLNAKVALMKVSAAETGIYMVYQREQKALLLAERFTEIQKFKVDISRTTTKNLLQLFFTVKTDDGDAILNALEDVLGENALLVMLSRLQRYVDGTPWYEIRGLQQYENVKKIIDDSLTGIMESEYRTGIYINNFINSFVNADPILRDISPVYIAANSGELKEILGNLQTMFPDLPAIAITEDMTSSDTLTLLQRTFNDFSGSRNFAYIKITEKGGTIKYIACVSGGDNSIAIFEDATHSSGLKEYRNIPGNALEEASRQETEGAQRTSDGIIYSNKAKGRVKIRTWDTELILTRLVRDRYLYTNGAPSLIAIEIVTKLPPCPVCLNNIMITAPHFPGVEFTVKYFPQTEASYRAAINGEVKPSVSGIRYKPRREVKI